MTVAKVFLKIKFLFDESTKAVCPIVLNQNCLQQISCQAFVPITMAYFSDSPLEVIEQVINALQEDPAALKACSQTCSSLLPLCRKYSFSPSNSLLALGRRHNFHAFHASLYCLDVFWTAIQELPIMFEISRIKPKPRL